jgi:hypothetical protein
MSKEFKFDPYWIIARVNAKGEQEYFGIDQHSGGYPYWSSFPTSAKKFDTVPDVAKHVDSYMHQEGASVFVLACHIEVKATAFNDAVEQARLARIRELKEQQQALQVEIDKLS